MSDALFRQLAEAGGSARQERERDLNVAAQIYASLHDKQKIAADDPNDYIAVITPRRAGKSHWAGVGKALRKCLMTPGARVPVIGLTLRSAKASFWRALTSECKRRGIEVDVNLTDLSLTFRNGSYIFLYGAETMDRIERMRGDEYDLVVIDEAGSFAPSTLAYLIHTVLKPAVGTRDGQIVLVGTPGFIFAGDFYYGTNPDKIDPRTKLTGKGHPISWRYDPKVGRRDDVMWSFHTWTMADNTAKKAQWERALRDKKRNNIRDDNPTWRREYLGEWVLSEDGLVYAYAACKNRDATAVTWSGDIEELKTGDWHFLCGIDFGFENPTAFTVAAYSREKQKLREIHSEKHSHLVLSDVAEIYRSLYQKYGGFEATVVDAGAQGKMIVETLRSDYGIMAQPAEKREKQAFQQAMNSDFHSGKIQVIENSELEKELLSLSWDLDAGDKDVLARKGRLRENPNQPNDASDSFLYVWRYSAHRWAPDEQVEGPKIGTAEYWLKWSIDEKEKFVERRRRDKEGFDDSLSYLMDHEEYVGNYGGRPLPFAGSW